MQDALRSRIGPVHGLTNGKLMRFLVAPSAGLHGEEESKEGQATCTVPSQCLRHCKRSMVSQLVIGSHSESIRTLNVWIGLL